MKTGDYYICEYWILYVENAELKQVRIIENFSNHNLHAKEYLIETKESLIRNHYRKIIDPKEIKRLDKLRLLKDL